MDNFQFANKWNKYPNYFYFWKLSNREKEGSYRRRSIRIKDNKSNKPTNLLTSLVSHSLCEGHCTDSTRLSYHYIAICGRTIGRKPLKQVLRHLSAFPTSGLSLDDNHSTGVHQTDDFISENKKCFTCQIYYNYINTVKPAITYVTKMDRYVNVVQYNLNTVIYVVHTPRLSHIPTAGNWARYQRFYYIFCIIISYN